MILAYPLTMNEELFEKMILMHLGLAVIVGVIWLISEWRERRKRR
jgi:hypothetical protein